QIEGLAADLKGAESPGLLLSHSVGRYAAGTAVAAAVREMAAALGAQLWPLLTSTNSAALPALKQKCGAVELTDLLQAPEADRPKAVLLVGLDPACALPERLCEVLAEGRELLCWAGSLASPFSERADIVVPLALPWEEEGTVLAPTGKPAGFVSWMALPAGPVLAGELMARLAAEAGLGVLEALSAEDLVSARASVAPVGELLGEDILQAPEPQKGQAVIVGAPEPQGYTGGISLAGASWQVRVAAEEWGAVSQDLAEELSLADGEALALSDGVQSIVPCKVEKGGGSVLALPSHWPVLRELLLWPAEDGVLEPTPVVVDVRKA
ncbi:MAG: hypothetical protein ACYS8K_06665, partial [Planctomycetota bacterium]